MTIPNEETIVQNHACAGCSYHIGGEISMLVIGNGKLPSNRKTNLLEQRLSLCNIVLAVTR